MKYLDTACLDAVQGVDLHSKGAEQDKRALRIVVYGFRHDIYKMLNGEMSATDIARIEQLYGDQNLTSLRDFTTKIIAEALNMRPVQSVRSAPETTKLELSTAGFDAASCLADTAEPHDPLSLDVLGSMRQSREAMIKLLGTQNISSRDVDNHLKLIVDNFDVPVIFKNAVLKLLNESLTDRKAKPGRTPGSKNKKAGKNKPRKPEMSPEEFEALVEEYKEYVDEAIGLWRDRPSKGNEPALNIGSVKKFSQLPDQLKHLLLYYPFYHKVTEDNSLGGNAVWKEQAEELMGDHDFKYEPHRRALVEAIVSEMDGARRDIDALAALYESVKAATAHLKTSLRVRSNWWDKFHAAMDTVQGTTS